MADQERVQILLDKDLKNKIDARAKLEGMNRSELIRLACEMYLSDHAANDGLDTTSRLLRKIIQDEMNPQINRLAKMISKNTKAAATSMYMQVVSLGCCP